MAICIDFELIEVKGSVARYRYGSCLRELDQTLEVDIEKLLTGDTPLDTPLDKVVIIPSGQNSEWMAYRVFSKVYKYYKEHGEYPQKGGYYA
ncbi:hypothetical protein GCM10010912_05880 [Paenibacillus albidus]|uniref:Uncharacterized protein n=1 Tax=Paenibacillus albidus TaxID=2041023 RepID=A0A917C040_9BACL|nr:hypothetical protein [Paenibacillus albidus]GGF63633.1 hypothetical protein GCM10010912_05880 [Paenibacillus albidus]